MECPKIKKLPPPPPDKKGWPWTEESEQLPPRMPDNTPWPKISIVTPSYNQGQFIEETIRSVLLQGYPNLEYIIIDGGSTDQTVEIIKRYEEWITYWVSESDQGQANAINKGITECNGDIFAWINSDDLYCPGAFEMVSQAMWNNGKISNPIIYGHSYWIDDNGNLLSESLSTTVTRNDLIAFWRSKKTINQPSFFLSLELMKEYRLNNTLHYALDWDLWLRLSCNYDFILFPHFLSFFRFYQASKSGSGNKSFFKEQILISKKYWDLNKLRYFRMWVSYKWNLIKRFFLKIYLIIKSYICFIIGKRNYNLLKNIKNRIFEKHIQ
jgi:glycosyltransferase involved in cell wall biosynthesis